MARTFVAASSQRLTRTAAPITAYPFTLAAWMKPVSIVDGGFHAALTLVKAGSSPASFATLYQHNGDVQAWMTGSGAGGGSVATGLSAGVWGHGAAVYASSTSRTAYVNGTAGSAETSSQGTIAFDTMQVGADYFGGGPAANDFFDGDLAEAGLWDVALDAGEILALSKGLDPRFIRPSHLIAYWPITGNESPELDRWASRYDLTLTGTPAKTDHPRVYRRTRARVTVPAIAAEVFGAVAITLGTLTASAQGAVGVPAAPSSPSPADAAAGQAVAPTLTWTALGATSYDVYFGTSSPPPLVSSAQPAASYTPPGPLNPETTYYWKVVGSNVNGIGVAGPVWSFATLDPYQVLMTIAGVSPHTRLAALTIRDLLNDAPNTCKFTVDRARPSVGQEIKIGLGGLAGAALLFAGTIDNVEQFYEGGKQSLMAWRVSCQDFTRTINRRKVRSRYGQQSATAIAIDLVPAGFSAAGIAAGLPTVAGGIDYTDEDRMTCYRRLATRIGGYADVDYEKVVKLFLEDTSDAPDDLIVGSRTLMNEPPITWRIDLTQIRTRVYVEGGGSAALAALVAGETILPVGQIDWYLAGGGLVVAGPQRIAYAGIALGGGGGLVGPGAAPSSGPALALVVGAGMANGVHLYAVTFQTASGESIPGPTVSITVSNIAAPASALVAGSATSGGFVDTGSHDYVLTNVTSSGETDPSPISNAVVSGGVGGYVTPPSSGMVSTNWEQPSFYSPLWNIGDTVSCVLTYVNAYGETTAGPATAPFIAKDIHDFGSPAHLPCAMELENIPVSPDGSITEKRAYIKVNGSFINQYVLLTPGATQSLADGTWAGSPPGSNTAATGFTKTIPLSNLPIGPAGVTDRKLYRRFNGTGTFKLAGTITNNTATTYIDNNSNGTLGADAPTSNTATANQVGLSGIPIGGATVTGRKIYRTVAAGSQLKLVTTIANNTATTYTDSLADGSLGANAPTSDASGLAQPEGQVNTGSTSLIVAGTGAFTDGGGWAIIGNGAQVVRYTGVTANSLTGIPASGPGSIAASVSYNSTVTAAPALLGIPTSGAGAILYDMPASTSVNLLVQVDDVAAQMALAELEGGSSDGIIEHTIQDRRLSHPEALAVGTADLAVFSRPITRISYVSRDIKSKSGKTVHVDRPELGLLGDWTIQSVTIDEIGAAPRTFPRYTVEASSVRFSLEDVLRRLVMAA